jgi:hypothetical protein
MLFPLFFPSFLYHVIPAGPVRRAFGIQFTCQLPNVYSIFYTTVSPPKRKIAQAPIALVATAHWLDTQSGSAFWWMNRWLL